MQQVRQIVHRLIRWRAGHHAPVSQPTQAMPTRPTEHELLIQFYGYDKALYDASRQDA